MQAQNPNFETNGLPAQPAVSGASKSSFTPSRALRDDSCLQFQTELHIVLSIYSCALLAVFSCTLFTMASKRAPSTTPAAKTRFSSSPPPPPRAKAPKPQQQTRLRRIISSVKRGFSNLSGAVACPSRDDGTQHEEVRESARHDNARSTLSATMIARLRDCSLFHITLQTHDR